MILALSFPTSSALASSHCYYVPSYNQDYAKKRQIGHTVSDSFITVLGGENK